MKVFWHAVLLLLVLCMGCVLAAAQVRQLTDEIGGALDAARRAALDGRMAEARDGIAAAWSLWQAHSGFFGSTLRHAEMDELSYGFAALRQVSSLGDQAESLRLMAELRMRLAHLADMEWPHYHNIL